MDTGCNSLDIWPIAHLTLVRYAITQLIARHTTCRQFCIHVQKTIQQIIVGMIFTIRWAINNQSLSKTAGQSGQIWHITYVLHVACTSNALFFKFDLLLLKKVHKTKIWFTIVLLPDTTPLTVPATCARYCNVCLAFHDFPLPLLPKNTMDWSWREASISR